MIEIDDVAAVRDVAARLFADHTGDALREAAERGERPEALWRLCEDAGFVDALGEAPSLDALPIGAAVAFEAGRHALPMPLVDAMVARWMGDAQAAPATEHIDVAARPAARPFANAPASVRHAHLALRLQQAAGAMHAALALAVRHVNDRTQFGRPLAAFQAVAHQLAVAAEEAASARVAADHAVRRLAARGAADELAWRALAVARIRSGEASGRVIDATHQVHGAIGFTREYTLHHYTRRLMHWRDEHGTEAHWAIELGRRVAAHGDLWGFTIEDD